MNSEDSFHLEIEIYFLDLRIFYRRITGPATYFKKLSVINNQEYQISSHISAQRLSRVAGTKTK